MKPFNFLAVLWLIPGMTGAFAQTSQPKEPIVRRTPAFASWTITLNYKDEDAKPPAQGKPAILPDRIQSLTVTKTDTTYQELATWGSGKKEEKWIFNGVQLRMVPGTTVVVPVLPPSPDVPDPHYSDYSRSDFEGLEWVSLGNYQGVKTYEGKPAYQFESTESGRKLTAFLSIDTQLPLYISDGETTRIYVYNPAPLAPLSPPANFLSVLENYRKGTNALTRRPDAP